MSATNGQADGRPAFEHHAISAEQELDLRRQLLAQRLTALEAEHVQAVFAVEQIEKQIEHSRAELDEIDRAAPTRLS